MTIRIAWLRGLAGLRAAPRRAHGGDPIRDRGGADYGFVQPAGEDLLGGRLGGVELLGDEVEAAVPEARIGEVDADDPAELLGRAAAAAGEHLEVVGDDLLAALDVEAVDRERQQLPVGVGVDVAGRADEVGDVGPPGAVALGDLDGVAEQLGLASRPRARRSARPRARPRSRRAVWTRSSNWFIAICRKTVAIWPSIDSARRLSRERGSVACSSRRPKTSSSAKTEAVSATVSGVFWWIDALLGGEELMDAVAELVGERGHVAAPVGPVEHHVGVDGGDGRGAEGPAALAPAAAGRRSSARP